MKELIFTSATVLFIGLVSLTGNDDNAKKTSPVKTIETKSCTSPGSCGPQQGLMLYPAQQSCSGSNAGKCTPAKKKDNC